MDKHHESWQRLHVDDVEIEFTERGAGDAIFLVHAAVSSEWFRPIYDSPALDGFRRILPRRAGYGAFQPARHLTLTDHARHMGALADHLGLDGIHWVGHSSSCLIGLFLAADRPELVKSLTLMEPSAGGKGFDVPASYDRPDFIGPAFAAFQAADLSAAFDHFMHGVCGEGYRDVVEARLGRAGLENMIHQSAFLFRDEARAIMESEFGAAEAAKITQPVLCLSGGAQPPHLASFARQVSERVKEFMPQTEIVVIPDADHGLPLQNPLAIAREIASFITRITVKEPVSVR
jgi:pimeloyl-ACP methyl ester carboxylesterase